MIHAGFNSHELIYRLPKARADGSPQLHLTALELIDRLAALIPPPRIHRHRYHGVLALCTRATTAIEQCRNVGQ